MVSGDGSGRFELDRWYYALRVAIEFQGRHHHLIDARSAESRTRIKEQIARDNIKAGLCARAGVRYVEFTGRELNFERIIDKLEGVLPLLLPLVQVIERRPLMRKLSEMCHGYRNYVRLEEQKIRTGTTST